MNALRIVLVRPQLGENIGFVVRLCANFDVDDLVLVSPRVAWREGAERTASMCRERLEDVRVLELDEALAECTHVFGLTARHGRERSTAPLHMLGELCRTAGCGPQRHDDQAPESGELAATVARDEGEATRCALVFGSEDRGLEAEEVARCTQLVRLALPGLSSLNLSHAVALALHEFFRASEIPEGAGPAVEHSESHAWATHAERRRLAERARDCLRAWRFRVDDPHLDGALERLVETAQLQTRDARVLARIIRHLEWLDEQGEGPPPTC